MKNKKVIFFDIDGTLATPAGILTSNCKALQTLKEKGHHILISSGRPKWYIQQLFGDLVEGMISSNGRHIEYQNNIILDSPLTIDEIQHIIQLCEQTKCGYLLVGNKDIYIGNKTYIPSIPTSYQNRCQVQWDVQTLAPIYMFDVFYRDATHFQRICEAFKTTYILNDHHDGSADASTITHNKGHAVTYATSYLSLTKEDSFAFGDGANDVDMFHAVGTAIAMGNGVAIAKEAADYITDDITEDGITKALIHFDLL